MIKINLTLPWTAPRPLAIQTQFRVNWFKVVHKQTNKTKKQNKQTNNKKRANFTKTSIY